MSPAEWGGNPIVGPDGEPRIPAPPSKWPSRISGYAKLIATAITTMGTTGILQALQSAGVTSLPTWAIAGITAVVGLLTVLLSPKNKP